MIGYFDELSDAIRRAEVEESLLADIARRHDGNRRTGTRKLRLRDAPDFPATSRRA